MVLFQKEVALPRVLWAARRRVQPAFLKKPKVHQCTKNVGFLCSHRWVLPCSLFFGGPCSASRSRCGFKASWAWQGLNNNPSLQLLQSPLWNEAMKAPYWRPHPIARVEKGTKIAQTHCKALQEEKSKSLLFVQQTWSLLPQRITPQQTAASLQKAGYHLIFTSVVCRKRWGRTFCVHQHL